MNSIGTKTTETKELTLRQFDISDTDSVFENWASDEEVQKMYGEPACKSKENVHKLIKNYIASYKSKDFYRWAIVLKDTNICIGQIAFFLIDKKNHFAEVEYCIGREFQQKGYAREALNSVIQFGFEKIKLHKIQVSHMEQNIPSKNLILSCKFKYEGNARDYFYTDGEYFDRLYYSILKEEWEEMHSENINNLF